jgi:hypothetical protein
MPTPIGQDLVTSVSRHVILPTITDNFYKSNTLLWRMLQSNRRRIRGGTHIEGVQLYQDFAGGNGWFSGYDKLTITPQDTIKNARWEWAFAYQSVVIDGTSMVRMDSELAVADGISVIMNQAEMAMAEVMATALWNTGTDPKALDGLGHIVDDGTLASATYAELSRTTNTWWKAHYNGSSTVLSENLLMNTYFNCTDEGGGRTPTLIVSRFPQYVRYFNLNTVSVQYPLGTGGTDEIQFQKGVSNQVFNGIPWMVDSHVPVDGSSNSDIFFLNEDYLYLYELEGWNFTLDDFQQPWDQVVYVSTLKWGGQLVCLSPKHQGRIRGIAA